jgi:muramoyltetrapeptide carboxypeptidase
MAAYDFGAAEPSAYALEHCFAMLSSHEHAVDVELEGPAGPAVEGTLWGGNLSIVAHLVGTPYLPAIAGGLLFLEDVAEHPYRVERMLHQLHYAGILERQRAVLLGRFTEFALFPHDAGYDLDAVVAHARERFGVPIYTGLPFGHVHDKLTLPVGGRATLVPGASSSHLILRDHG